MNGATLDRGRLAKLLGMLGSAHAGEAINAARHVEAMRRASGLTWAAILDPPARPATLFDPPPPADRDVEQLRRELARARVEADGLWQRINELTAENERLKASPAAAAGNDWHAALDAIWEWRDRFQPKERDFIDQMMAYRRQGRAISPAQARWLDQLHSKAETFAAMAAV
ncbi:MAG TPA: hypothetical protein VMI30_14095 [Stellaceae bacterium]|nr:hypothetical protein [Stellaceae bacterium]